MAKNELWLEFVNKGLCGLCGNSGMVNTDVSTRAGVKCGVSRPCICPNGRILKRLEKKKEKNGTI